MSSARTACRKAGFINVLKKPVFPEPAHMHDEECRMPCYLVERTFVEDDYTAEGVADLASHLRCCAGNSEQTGVTWLASFVAQASRKTFCFYRASNPEALRQAAIAYDLPIDRINEIRLLFP